MSKENTTHVHVHVKCVWLKTQHRKLTRSQKTEKEKLQPKVFESIHFLF